MTSLFSVRFSNKCLLNITIKETYQISKYIQRGEIMQRTINSTVQITIQREIPQIVAPEKAEILATLCEKIAQNFLDIIILKKLNGKQMRLCELYRALKKEAFISIDPRKLHKRIKSMEKEEIIKICSIDGRKLYSLTDKGKKMIEVIQKQHCQINEIIQNVIS